MHNILWSSLFLNLSKCCLERIGTRQKKENKKGEKMKGEGVPNPPPPPPTRSSNFFSTTRKWSLRTCRPNNDHSIFRGKQRKLPRDKPQNRPMSNVQCLLEVRKAWDLHGKRNCSYFMNKITKIPHSWTEQWSHIYIWIHLFFF